MTYMGNIICIHDSFTGNIVGYRVLETRIWLTCHFSSPNPAFALNYVYNYKYEYFDFTWEEKYILKKITYCKEN